MSDSPCKIVLKSFMLHGQSHAIVPHNKPACAKWDSVVSGVPAESRREVSWDSYAARPNACPECVAAFLPKLTPDDRYPILQFMERVRLFAYGTLGKHIEGLTLSGLETKVSVQPAYLHGFVLAHTPLGYTFISAIIDFDESVGPRDENGKTPLAYVTRAFDDYAAELGRQLGEEAAQSIAEGYVNPALTR